MPRVIRSTPVDEDLLAIWSYIAALNISAADRLLDRIEQKCLLYATQPLLGRACPEIGPSVRCFTERSYVVIYRPIEDGIELLMVVHGARDIPAVFRERFGSE